MSPSFHMQTTIKHLGIIMDGNRRWAKERGLLSFEGHFAGYDKIQDVLTWCQDAGIKIVTLFAFSMENWNRAPAEVDALMKLFWKAFTEDLNRFHDKNLRLRVIGTRDRFSPKLQQAIAEAERKTSENTGMIVNLALSYGGRQELVDAVKAIVQNPPEEITEQTISDHVYTVGLPDPELIIRTSGENRLSGFLLWQSAYAEFCFIKHFWPDFSQEDFAEALANYEARKRRFGR